MAAATTAVPGGRSLYKRPSTTATSLSAVGVGRGDLAVAFAGRRIVSLWQFGVWNVGVWQFRTVAFELAAILLGRSELFSDAMGAEGTYEGTYIGMMDHNATTIARALGGEAPAGGMQGRLAPAASSE